VETISERGYAVSSGDHGMRTVATPIFTQRAGPIGAFGLRGPAVSMEGSGAGVSDDIERAVRRIADLVRVSFDYGN
jgi:DNA-binding IclR family transcriptional regulator